MTDERPKPTTDIDDFPIDYRAHRLDGDTHLVITTDPDEIDGDVWEYHQMLGDILSGELPPEEPCTDGIHLEPIFADLFAPGETVSIETAAERACAEMTDRIQRTYEDVMGAMVGDDDDETFEVEWGGDGDSPTGATDDDADDAEAFAGNYAGLYGSFTSEDQR